MEYVKLESVSRAKYEKVHENQGSLQKQNRASIGNP